MPHGPPPLSVLIATRNRASSLARLLHSLEVAAAGLDVETIVADNGSTDRTPEVLRTWAGSTPRRRWLRVELPGKARALNHALVEARGPLLAFVDDDEQVAAEWCREILAFCAAHPQYAAAIGRVLPPPDLTDAELLARLAWYRTIAFFDGGDSVHGVDTLYGGNMVLRRTALDTVGSFDERLGPGAAGGWEDIDLAGRLRAAGLYIGYMPRVIVYHAVDPARLTPQYFRQHNRVAAHSAYALDPRRAWRRSLPRLVDAAAGFLWWSVRGHPLRREHARGRLIRHAEVLRLHWRHVTGRTT
jgi:glycosyltransferase involved in cell wall biosynthesis